jgi:hypothetical protein
MKTEPDADSPSRHMDLVNFIHFVLRDRCSEYSVHDVCPETSSILGGQLFFRALPSNFHRCLGPSGQCIELYPNSLRLLVWDIYHTLVQE